MSFKLSKMSLFVAGALTAGALAAGEAVASEPQILVPQRAPALPTSPLPTTAAPTSAPLTAIAPAQKEKAPAPASKPATARKSTKAEQEAAETLAHLNKLMGQPQGAQGTGISGPTIAQAVASPRKMEPVVEAFRKWSERSPYPLRADGGVIRYPFAEMEPLIVCAELRICLVELKDDEVVEFLASGDADNWEFKVLQQGNRNVVTIKPRGADLETNLNIGTSQRTYSLALKSTKEQYVSRYAFYYPQSSVMNFAGKFKTAEQRAAEAQSSNKSEYQKDFEATLPPAVAAEVGVTPPPVTLTKGTASQASIAGAPLPSAAAPVPAPAPAAPAIDYTFSGEAPFKPVKAYSDGKKTFIQMPESVSASELPVLFILDERGNLGMPTPRFNAATRLFVVDFVVNKAVLMLGHGREAQRVEINRVTK